jgi:hypothetical protein
MVKTFHIMAKDEWRKHIHSFHPQYGSHYIDLPSGKILVATSFASEASEEHFDNADKLSLPHPIWEGNQKLNAGHVAELGHLGITEAHTVLDVARTVSKIHPLMKLRVF